MMTTKEVWTYIKDSACNYLFRICVYVCACVHACVIVYVCGFIRNLCSSVNALFVCMRVCACEGCLRFEAFTCKTVTNCSSYIRS